MTSPSPSATNVATHPLTAAWLFVSTVLFTIFVLSVPAVVQAQSYVYVNNQGVANSVAAFSVSPTGALSPVPGSPYLTGGIGSTATCFGLDRITISAPNNLLFVSNSGDQTISVFQINPASGVLTTAPGSPFASGLLLDGCQGISLAATPDGNFLMASSNGRIRTFAVAPTGVLTPAATTANCCSPTVGMKIAPNGKLLAVSNETSVSVYAINADGSLTAVAPGSPFARTGAGLVSGLEFSCAADRLYGSEASFGASSITDAWSVDATGILLPVAGSPFLAPGSDSNTLVLSPDNSLLFINDQFSNKISSFSVHADGTLASIGGFGGVTSVHVPAGLATDASGSFVFAADDSFGVAVFKINGTGGLSSVSDVAIGRPGAIQGLAAYPPRSCASADLALTETASPATVEAGSNVTYTVTITNNGPAASSATIVDNLPAGTSIVSCTATGNGVCSSALANPHIISFGSLASGATQTVTFVAQTSTTLLNGASLSNTVSIGNKSAIDPDLTNNSATATVSITAQLGPTTLKVSPATGSYGGLAVLTATLQRSSNGAAVGGKAVAFTLNGAPIGTAQTNGIGQAILTTSIAGIPLGTYPGAIGVSFAGDSLFNPSSGTASLTVNKAVLTVIASSAAKIYGDPNPAFTYAISGFLNADTSAVVNGTATCTSATDAAAPVGRYPVTCDLGSLSAANYVLTVFPGTLIVNPAPLTVAADNATRIYGDPNPAFTGTINGLRNGDNITATFFSTATAGSPVGTYPILPAYVDPAGRLSNYTPAVSGTLTITTAQLTVTADTASRAYGDPNPVFTGVITGVRNGDNITATYSSPAVLTSPVGAYPIVPALVDPTTKLGNYSATVNDGTLTITPAPLTVNAANASRLYGDPNPVFTGAIVGIKNGDAITATYSSPADPTSAVGAYPIIPALVDPTTKLGNYSVTPINGVLTINPAPFSVAANNASRVYGNANPAFTGTVTGLKNLDPITANFSTVATPASPVGTYPIVFASFNDPAGKLGNYTVTSTKNATLTVTRAPLTASGFNGSRFYGDPNPAPAITGLKNGDAITGAYDATAPGPATPAGGTSNLAPVLNDPTSKLSNYTVTIQNGKITITKAPLSVVANNVARPFGSLNPTLTGTITGVKNGESITASFTTTATQTSNAGTFAITAAVVFSPASLSANYNLTLTNGTLTITPVPLAITANNQIVVLNGALANSAAYSGFVLGQTPANLSGTLSCSSNGSTIGTHTITCSGQSSTNYAISFLPGAETVIYAPVGTCAAGPGHQILAPIAVNGTTVFTRATTATIPVQFRVCDARGTAVSSTVVSSFTLLQSITGAVTTNLNQPQSTAFAFQGGPQDWLLNLSTTTPTNLAAGTTYVYQIGLNDGTSITFQFAMQ